MNVKKMVHVDCQGTQPHLTLKVPAEIAFQSVVCWKYICKHWIIEYNANSVDPDETAPLTWVYTVGDI